MTIDRGIAEITALSMNNGFTYVGIVDNPKEILLQDTIPMYCYEIYSTIEFSKGIDETIREIQRNSEESIEEHRKTFDKKLDERLKAPMAELEASANYQKLLEGGWSKVNERDTERDKIRAPIRKQLEKEIAIKKLVEERSITVTYGYAAGDYYYSSGSNNFRGDRKSKNNPIFLKTQNIASLILPPGVRPLEKRNYLNRIKEFVYKITTLHKKTDSKDNQ